MTNEATTGVTSSKLPIACLQGPQVVSLDVYANVPLELREMDIWMPFKLEPRANGKQGKPPVDRKGQLASGWNKSESWLSFDDARGVMRHLNLPGIGIVFSRELGLYGYDADDVLANDELRTRTLRHLQLLGTYAETSYSKTGIHAIGRGVPLGEKHKCDPYELYCDRRFFVVTGRAVPGMPATLESNQPGLDEVYQDIFGRLPEGNIVTDYVTDYVTGQIPANQLIQQVVTPVSLFVLDTREKEERVLREREREREGPRGPTLTDEEILQLLRLEKSGVSLQLYWSGCRPGKNPSNEDWALVGKLMFYCRRNTAQIYRLFLASALYRSKCDEDRAGNDYAAYTIGQYLIKGNRAVWNPGRHSKQAVGRKPGRPQGERVRFAIELHQERPDLLPAEISSILGLSRGSVRNALSRHRHQKQAPLQVVTLT